MLEPFYPKHYVTSAYGIPYGKVYEKGVRGVIFDVDNTLVADNAPADDRARRLFGKLREMGMETCLLSNNREPRVAAFAGEVGTKYIYKGNKPSTKGYVHAMELMGTAPESTICVGDQLFTDIWGANRSGIESYLAKPIDPREEIQIRLKRWPEKVVLHFYRRKRREIRK